MKKDDFTRGEGLRERAEASLGREKRMRLQRWFQDLLTHAADAKDKAGSLERMLWRRSSLIGVSTVNGFLGSQLVFDNDSCSPSAIAWSLCLPRANCFGSPNHKHAFQGPFGN